MVKWETRLEYKINRNNDDDDNNNSNDVLIMYSMLMYILVFQFIIEEENQKLFQNIRQKNDKITEKCISQKSGILSHKTEHYQRKVGESYFNNFDNFVIFVGGISPDPGHPTIAFPLLVGCTPGMVQNP